MPPTPSASTSTRPSRRCEPKSRSSRDCQKRCRNQRSVHAPRAARRVPGVERTAEVPSQNRRASGFCQSSSR
jgi:hypothetical protein